MQANPAVEQSKIIRWSESLWNQSGRKLKGNGVMEERIWKFLREPVSLSGT